MENRESCKHASSDFRHSSLPGDIHVMSCKKRSGVCRFPILHSRFSVPKRLTGFQHVLDPGLGLRHLRQGDEVLALQADQPFFID